MNYTVQIEHVTGQPIAVVRRRVAPRELPRIVPESCGLVWKTVRAAQVKDAGRHVAVYRCADDGRLDVEVGVEVGSAFAGRDEVVGSVTPAGDVATVTHFGPYQKLGEAHQAIRSWAAAGRRELAGVNWEIYGHWVDEWNDDLSKIRTDVYHLLLSLKAYIRLAGLPTKRPAPETVKLFQSALALAKRPDEKKQALGGLGELKDGKALEAVAPYLSEEAVIGEACAAAIKLAKEKDVWEKNKDLAKTTMTKVTEVGKTDAQKKSAKEILDKIAASMPKKPA